MCYKITNHIKAVEKQHEHHTIELNSTTQQHTANYSTQSELEGYSVKSPIWNHIEIHKIWIIIWICNKFPQDPWIILWEVNENIENTISHNIIERGKINWLAQTVFVYKVLCPSNTFSFSFSYKETQIGIRTSE